MSDQTTPTPPPSPHDVVVADIKKYGNELVPGAAEKLGALWSGLGTEQPDARAEKIATRLGEPWAQQFRNPEFVAPKNANGSDQSPLRQALERNAPRLRPGEVDVLTNELAGEVAGKTPSQIAGHVERFISTRDARSHMPEEASRLGEIIRRNFPGVGNDLIASVQRSQQYHGMAESQLVVIVANTLGLPHTDPRSQGRSAPNPNRPEPEPRSELVRNLDGSWTQPRKSLVK
jgi:hypothetical protein